MEHESWNLNRSWWLVSTLTKRSGTPWPLPKMPLVSELQNLHKHFPKALRQLRSANMTVNYWSVPTRATRWRHAYNSCQDLRSNVFLKTGWLDVKIVLSDLAVYEHFLDVLLRWLRMISCWKSSQILQRRASRNTFCQKTCDCSLWITTDHNCQTRSVMRWGTAFTEPIWCTGHLSRDKACLRSGSRTSIW